jgi:hypothetical protein
VVCTPVFLEGMSHREVAARLGISVKAVEKQAARGRRHVRTMLGSAWGQAVSTNEDGGENRWGCLTGWERRVSSAEAARGQLPT